jgi:hypothetical protein
MESIKCRYTASIRHFTVSKQFRHAVQKNNKLIDISASAQRPNAIMLTIHVVHSTINCAKAPVTQTAENDPMKQILTLITQCSC